MLPNKDKHIPLKNRWVNAGYEHEELSHYIILRKKEWRSKFVGYRFNLKNEVVEIMPDTASISIEDLILIQEQIKELHWKGSSSLYAKN